MRKFLAVILGAAVAGSTVAGVEKLGNLAFPPPADLDWQDTAMIAAYLAELPLSAFMFVLAAWVTAAFLGSVVATLVARHRSYIYAVIVTGLILAASIVNLVMIPHPLWFSVAAIVFEPVAGYLAWVVSRQFLPQI